MGALDLLSLRIGELAEIAACFNEIASLGVVERRAALALLDEFTAYARRQSRRR